MISNILLDLVYIFATGIVALVGSFGEVSANNAVTTSLVLFQSYYVSLSIIVPLTTILAIIAFDLAFEGFVFLYKMIRWGYQKVPGVN